MSRVPITPPSNSTPAADRRLGQAVVLGRWGLADAGRRRVAVRLGPARRTGPPRRSRTGRSAWPRGRVGGIDRHGAGCLSGTWLANRSAGQGASADHEPLPGRCRLAGSLTGPRSQT